MKIKLSLLGAFLMAASSSIAVASYLPNLPEGVTGGTGVIINNVIYLGLGSAGKSWYKLDLSASNKEWVKQADFPGVDEKQAISVAFNDKVYLFGGVGKNKEGLTSVITDSYSYDPATNSWTKLDTNIPFGLVGGSAFVLENKILLTGGVNQNIFNGYFVDNSQAGDDQSKKDKINFDYFNKPYADYFYNNKVMSYDPNNQSWGNVGQFKEDTGRAGATAYVHNNTLYYISGEVKPGLRTDKAYTASFNKGKLEWQSIAGIPNIEGTAGGYSGESGGYVLYAGGSYFPGSHDNYYKLGNYHAHKGFPRTYGDLVYGYKYGKWSELGKLPQARGYGVYLPYKNGVLFIAGEDSSRTALTDSYYLEVSGNKLTIHQ